MPLPQKKLIPGILLMLALVAFALPPLWWSAGDSPVIDPGAQENNKGSANIGQAKHMAKSALDALSTVLPGVADEIEADLTEGANPILDFTVPADPKPADWADKQKAPLLIGQLKAIADPFYTRLHAAAPTWLEAERTLNGTNHPNSIFPWTAETTDDANKAIANIGQLKAVFSLRFNTVLPEEQMPRLAVNGALSVMVVDGEGNPQDAIPLLFQRITGDGNFPGGAIVTTRSTDPTGIVSIADYTSPEGDVIQVTMLTPYGDQNVWLPANTSGANYFARTGSGGLEFDAPFSSGTTPPPETEDPDPESDPIPVVMNIDNYVNYVSTLYGTETSVTVSETFQRIETYDPVNEFDPVRDGQSPYFNYAGFPSAARVNGFVAEAVLTADPAFNLTEELGISIGLQDYPVGYDGMRVQYGFVKWLKDHSTREEQVTIDGTKEIHLSATTRNVAVPAPPAINGKSAETGVIFGPFLSSEDDDDERYKALDKDENDNPIDPPIRRFNTSLSWNELRDERIEIDEELPTVLNVSFLRSAGLAKIPSGPRGGASLGAGLFVKVASSNSNIGVRLDFEPNGGFSQTVDKNLGATGEMTDLGIKVIGTGNFFSSQVNISLRHRDKPEEVIVEKTFDVVVSSNAEDEDPEIRNHSVNHDESSGPRYRKIALNGLPLSDEKPQSEDETDEEKEETYVDALTRELRHSTTDIYIPVPASELALTIRRNAASESWSTQTDLYPSEDPTLAFGPAWRSNLGAHVKLVEQYVPGAGGDTLVANIGAAARKEQGLVQSDPNYAYVTDEDGSTHRFLIAYTWPQTSEGVIGRYYLPAPNSRNESEAYEMTLAGSPDEGFTFTRKHGNTLVYSPTCLSFSLDGVRTHKPPGSTDFEDGGLFERPVGLPAAGGTPGSGQMQSYRYHRLLSVTDRTGNRINFTFDGTQDLVPSEMAVEGRPKLSVKIVSDDRGRVQAAYDANGNETSYTYGPTGDGALSEVTQAGDRTAKYGYKAWEEEDYRGASPNGAGQTCIPWTQNPPGSAEAFTQHEDKIQHFDLETLTDAQENTVTFVYTPDKSHLVTEYSSGVGVVALSGGGEGLKASSPTRFTYPLAGYPPDVAEIILPDGENVLIGGGNGLPVAEGGTGVGSEVRHTTVLDAADNLRTYRWPTFVTVVLDQDNLGYASAERTSGFNSLSEATGATRESPRGQGTTTHFTYFTSMEIEYEAGGKERYEFNTAAGSALAQITDADGNVTSYGHGEDLTGQLVDSLSVPDQNGGIFPLYNPEPTSQRDALLRVKRFSYGDFGIMDAEIATTGNKTDYEVDELGRRTVVKVYDFGDVLLSETEFNYHSDTPGTGFPGFMTRKTVKNTGALSASDPGWVVPLTTLYEPDANGQPGSNGRVGREAIDMDGDNAFSPGDLITTYTYDRNGNKLTATDPAGLTTWFHYDSRHRLISVTYPDGTSTQTVYDKRGNKVLTLDERGIATGYLYDVRGRLTETVRDMNGNLEYDSDLGLLTGIDRVQEPDPDPNTVIVPPDIISAVTYNEVNSPITSTDPRGYVTKTEYDHLQRPIRIYTPGPTREPGDIPDDAETDQLTQLFYDGGNSGGGFFNTSGYKPTKSIDPRGYVTLATYDALYRPVLSLSQYSKDPDLYAGTSQYYHPSADVVVQSFKYRDALDENFTPVEAGGNAPLSTLTEYDALFRPKAVTEGFGTPIAATNYTAYTSTGLVHRTYRQLTSAFVFPGQYPTSTTEFAISDMEYDAAGRPVKSIAPAVPLDGTATMVRPQTLTAYDLSGNPTETTDPRGFVTTVIHDARNRAVQVISPEVPFGTGQQTAHAFTTTEYDRAGNPVKITDPRGHVTETKYDDANRPYETTSPPVEVDGVLATITTATEYDLGGNVIAVTDGRGSKTINTYDPLSRLLTTKTNPTVVASTLSHADDILVSNDYDKSGNLVTVTDGAGQITSFEYDGSGRKTKTIWDSNDQARLKTELTEYDAALAIRSTSPKTEVTEFFYDGRFRLTDTAYLSRTVDNIHNDYDLAGRLLATSYPNESLENQALRSGAWGYDALDRLSVETSNGVSHTTGYDLSGNIVIQRYGVTNRTLVCGYDALNRLTVCGESINQAGAVRTTSYAYDLSGNIVRKTLPNGTFAEKEFDALNRARLISNRDSLANVISEYGYHFDAVGNVTRTAEAYAGSAMDDRILTNAYDKANRLRVETITAAGTVTATSYLYDKANNRTEKSVAVDAGLPEVWAYTYGNAANGFNSNQLVGYTRPDSTLVSFTYDANGSRATRSIGAATDTYNYDQSRRLISLDYRTDPVSAKHGLYEYAYDHRTRRVLRDESDAGGGRIKGVFSGGLSVQEYEGETVLAELEVEYIRGSDYGGGVGGVLYTARGGDFSFNSYNSRGDVTGQTDATGSSTWQAAYEAFGTRTQENGSTQDRQKANTKEEDPTGLLNEHFRYRDLEAGVFITRDPLGFVDGPNVYTYVRQNPWTKFDPHGLQSNREKRDEKKAREAAEKASRETEKKEAENSAKLTRERNEELLKHAQNPKFKRLVSEKLDELREATKNSANENESGLGNEFGAQIGVNKNGDYIAGEKVEGSLTQVTDAQIRKSVLPEGYEIIAVAHSHPDNRDGNLGVVSMDGTVINKGKMSHFSVYKEAGDLNYAHSRGVINTVVTPDGSKEMAVPKGGGMENWRILNPHSRYYKDSENYLIDNTIFGELKIKQ